jgi:hypothetical protein
LKQGLLKVEDHVEKLSEGSRRKLKGNSGYTAAASGSYIRTPSGAGSGNRNSCIIIIRKAFMVLYSDNLKFCLEVSI